MAFEPDLAHKSEDALEKTNKIRVVRIIDRLNIGGPAKHVVWLTAGLDPTRFETTLIAGTVPEGEGDMSYFAQENGVQPIVIERMSRELGARDVLVVLTLLRILFKLRPDIVHTHKSKAGAAGRIAAFLYRWMTLSALILRPRKCKTVHTFHGHIFRGYYGKLKTRLFVLIERFLARLGTDRILVLSERQRQEICEEFRVGRREHFRVIPLGVDLTGDGEAPGPGSELQASLRSQLGAGPSETLVGIVGRLCEVKNHSMLLHAAAPLLSHGEPAKARLHLAVIGDGHLREELEAKASRLGIAERVTFSGFRKDVRQLYGALDAVA
ncbi:MAG TPA: glycosyltransferase, partial [Blastocatellia bacterium]|nr:glycosyltransferase [Blastocatellia bacterium]